MAVLPRGSGDAAGTDGQITSPRVATSTVIGMVLGILCLFTMVISYQLVSTPCKRRGKAGTNSKRPATRTATFTHTPSKPTRSFPSLKHLFQRSRATPNSKHTTAYGEKQSRGTTDDPSSPRPATLRALYLASTKPLRSALHPSPKESPNSGDTSRTPNLRERRALRSLYLNTRSPTTPTKRYPCNPSPSPTTPTRKRMAGLLHLNTGGSLDSPGLLTPTFSPRSAKSRRLYQKLDDTAYSDWSNEESYQTERPVSALISPWSPSEYEFPYPSFHSPLFSAGEPMTPPPLYPPPPAYIPEVPLRSPGSAPATPRRQAEMTEVKRRASSPTLAVPVSPIVSTLTEEIASDIDAWSALRQNPPGANAHPPAHVPDGVFVIANESEDGMSNRDSISTVYTQESGTWEAFDDI